MSDQEDKSALKKNWALSAIALFLGIGIVTLAVVDYIQSPPDHKGIEVGPIFIPVGPQAPTAKQTPHPTTGQQTPPPTQPRRMIFAYASSANPSATVASMPKVVTGVSWVVAWRDVEPRAPANGRHTYNWSRIDRDLAAAAGSGRTSMVRVIAGTLSS